MTDQEFVLCKWKRRLWPAKVMRNEEMFVAVAWKGVKWSSKEGRGPNKHVWT
uniref:PWWP domain-containing protein n=1 Tax=Malurus cyaneus samueli TaxID=2593467 RepID=A0A8C5UFN3_9PASS